ASGAVPTSTGDASRTGVRGHAAQERRFAHPTRKGNPMRHIDAFCHFFPQSLFEKMSQTTGGTRDIGKRMQGVRTIWDLDTRLKMMDEFADYSEILSLGLPPIEAMAGPDQAPELARVAND